MKMSQPVVPARHRQISGSKLKQCYRFLTCIANLNPSGNYIRSFISLIALFHPNRIYLIFQKHFQNLTIVNPVLLYIIYSQIQWHIAVGMGNCDRLFAYGLKTECWITIRFESQTGIINILDLNGSDAHSIILHFWLFTLIGRNQQWGPRSGNQVIFWQQWSWYQQPHCHH